MWRKPLYRHRNSQLLNSKRVASCTGRATRVQGSRGGGRRFPQQLVHSARDEDGDGVVCERKKRKSTERTECKTASSPAYPTSSGESPTTCSETSTSGASTAT